MKKEIRQKGALYRKCALCGLRARKNEYDFLRIVRTPEGAVLFDPTGKLPGRGAYLCRNSECVRRALRSNRLSHLLRAPVSEEVCQQLRQEAGIDEP